MSDLALGLTDILYTTSSLDPTRENILADYNWFKSKLGKIVTGPPPNLEPEWERTQTRLHTWQLSPFTIRDDYLSVKQSFEHMSPITRVDMILTVSIDPDMRPSKPDEWKSLGWLILGSRHTDWDQRLFSMDINLHSSEIRIGTGRHKRQRAKADVPGELISAILSGESLTIEISALAKEKTFVSASNAKWGISLEVDCDTQPHTELLFGFGNDLNEEPKSIGFTVEAELAINP
jgi:hypothetical protein